MSKKIFKYVAMPGIYTVTAPTNIAVRYNGVVLTSGGETVSFPQSQSQETLEVQVAAPGAAALTVSFTGTGVAEGYNCSTYVNIRTWGVDIGVDADYDGDCDAQDDPLEETQGGLAAVGASALTPLDIAFSTAGLSSGTLTLEALSGGDKIRVRTGNTTNSAAISLPKTWAAGETIPSRIWMQGLSHSDTPRDVSLRLTGSLQGTTCEDIVSLTVVQVEFAEDPDQNYGFDPSGPWISAETTHSTTARVKVMPSDLAQHFTFASSDSTRATCSYALLSGNQDAQILLSIMAGSQPGDTAAITARAFNLPTSFATLRVAVYPKKIIPCYFHRVNGYSGDIPVSGVNELLKQAVAEIENMGVDLVFVDFSAGYANDLDEEYNEQYNLANTGINVSGDNDVFLLPDNVRIRTIDREVRLGWHISEKVKFSNNQEGYVHFSMISGAAYPFERYVAHEILHQWLFVSSNVGNPVHSLDVDNIMYPDPGKRLTKENWDNLSR